MARSLGLIFIVAASAGCFGAEALSQVSAGYVGCGADEIEITNDEAGFNQRSWDASCRGRTYHCSAVSKAGMACTEDRAASTSAKVAAAPSPSSLRASPPAHSWVSFSAKDCGIAVLLPGKPEEERETVKTKIGPVNGYSATVDLGKAAAFVGCTTLPKKALALDKSLDGTRDGALEEMGAEFESERDVEVGDFKGREVRFTVGGEQGKLRVLRQGHEIVTMGLVPSKSFSNTEARTFFETIDVLGGSDGGAP